MKAFITSWSILLAGFAGNFPVTCAACKGCVCREIPSALFPAAVGASSANNGYYIERCAAGQHKPPAIYPPRPSTTCTPGDTNVCRRRRRRHRRRRRRQRQRRWQLLHTHTHTHAYATVRCGGGGSRNWRTCDHIAGVRYNVVVHGRHLVRYCAHGLH